MKPTAIAFDIETIPDTDLLRMLHNKPEAGDDEIIALAKEEQLSKSDGRSDFLPLPFHKVAVVSIVLRTNDQLRIDSKTPPENDEKQAVEGFFRLIDRFTPTLISWNGNSFDLPVLAMRSLRLGIVSTGYWQGPEDKWRQYTSRFHDAHQDVMDLLAHRQARSAAKLETIALSCGLPGKMGYAGDQVWNLYQNQQFGEISNYCEIDALNTYLLWLRFQLISGRLPPARYNEECTIVENHLASSPAAHLQKFLEIWIKNRPTK